MHRYEFTAVEYSLSVKYEGFEGCFFYFTLTVSHGLRESYVSIVYNTSWALMNIANLNVI